MTAATRPARSREDAPLHELVADLFLACDWCPHCGIPVLVVNGDRSLLDGHVTRVHPRRSWRPRS